MIRCVQDKVYIKLSFLDSKCLKLDSASYRVAFFMMKVKIIPLKVIKSSNQAISLPNTTYNQNCYRDWRFLNCLFSMLLTSTKNTYSHHMKTALPARLLVWSSCETLSSCLSPFFSNQVPWGTFLASVHQYFKLHHGYMRQKEMETG